MSKSITRLSTNNRGATMIEYALIAALIAVVLVGALQLVGGSLDTTFTNVSDSFPEGG